MYVNIWYQNNVVILIVWNKILFHSHYISEAGAAECQQPCQPSSPLLASTKETRKSHFPSWPCSMGWPGDSSGHWDLSRSLKGPSERALVILAKCIYAPSHPPTFPPALTKPAHQWRWKEDRGQSSLVISLTYAPFLVRCLRDTLKYLHCLSHSEILLHAAKRIPNWGM